MNRKELSYVFVINKTFDEPRVLLLKRPLDKKHNPGKWNLPGGKLEDKETAIVCALRELEEETKIVPKNIKFLQEYIDGDLVIQIYKCYVKKVIVELCDEHITHEWVSLNEINNYKTLPYIKKLINQLIR